MADKITKTEVLDLIQATSQYGYSLGEVELPDLPGGKEVMAEYNEAFAKLQAAYGKLGTWAIENMK
jgi:hypothetical protein